MITKILTLLQGLCNALAWWRKRSHKKERDAISQAVHEGDDKAVNDLNAKILKESLRLLLLCTVLLPLLGCEPRTVFVPEGARAIPLEHDGVQGWWEPNHLYEAKLLILHEHLEHCHKE